MKHEAEELFCLRQVSGQGANQRRGVVQVLNRLSASHKCLIWCANNLCSDMIGHYKRKWWRQVQSVAVKESGSDCRAQFGLLQQITPLASTVCFYEKGLQKRSWHSSNDPANICTLLTCPWIWHWSPNTDSGVLFFFFNFSCEAGQVKQKRQISPPRDQ